MASRLGTAHFAETPPPGRSAGVGEAEYMPLPSFPAPAVCWIAGAAGCQVYANARYCAPILPPSPFPIIIAATETQN